MCQNAGDLPRRGCRRCFRRVDGREMARNGPAGPARDTRRARIDSEARSLSKRLKITPFRGGGYAPSLWPAKTPESVIDTSSYSLQNASMGKIGILDFKTILPFQGVGQKLKFKDFQVVPWSF
jgi:hypothetical protein